MEEIRPLASEAESCAQMMCATEPWLTLGRTFDESLAVIRDPTQEVYVAVAGEQLLGFIIIMMRGAFTGYIRSVCVAERARGRGVGTRLVEFAERRIFRETPNVFLCV